MSQVVIETRPEDGAADDQNTLRRQYAAGCLKKSVNLFGLKVLDDVGTVQPIKTGGRVGNFDS